MDFNELKQTWNAHARKLDQVLSMNLRAFKTTQLDKTQTALSRFKKFLLFETMIGIALLIASGSYIADTFSVPTLTVPAFIFAASVLVAVIAGIRKLVLLEQINYAGPVTAIQKKLEQIKLHFLGTIRLMVLMLPLYMVYVVLGLNLLFGWDILRYGNPAFLWANLVVSLIFVAPALWIFRNLSFEKIDNPLIRSLIHGSGGKQMLAALEFLKVLRNFENELATETGPQTLQA